MDLHDWRNIALPHRNILDGVHQLRDLHVLGTPFKAGVAGGTEPDELAGEDLLLHPQDRHPNNLSRIISVRDLPDRAPRSAGSAGEAPFDVISPWLFGNEQFEIRIKVF